MFLIKSFFVEIKSQFFGPFHKILVSLLFDTFNGTSFNFNTLAKNNSTNSTYNGIAFTVDMLDDNPDKLRLLALRSFGESFYHSITDASLEFGFKSI